MKTMYDVRRYINSLAYACEIIMQIGDRRNHIILSSDSYVRLMPKSGPLRFDKTVLHIIRENNFPFDETIKNIFKWGIPIFSCIASVGPKEINASKTFKNGFFKFPPPFIAFRQYVLSQSFIFASDMHELCEDVRMDINVLLAQEVIGIRFKFYRDTVHCVWTNSEYDNLEQNTCSKTMPITYRRATVWALLNKLGVSKNKDRTKIASFVEAVTGGNIEAQPKDTGSYKVPTKNAQNAATELLKKIDIE